jgi:hypothetical protein
VRRYDPAAFISVDIMFQRVMGEVDVVQKYLSQTRCAGWMAGDILLTSSSLFVTAITIVQTVDEVQQLSAVSFT